MKPAETSPARAPDDTAFGVTQQSPHTVGASPHRRARCIFLVHHVEAVDAVADVCFEMMRSPDFEAIVLSIPRRFPGSNTFAGEDAVHLGLDALGIDHIRFHVQDDLGCGRVLRLLQPDFVFRQAPWDYDIQPGFAHDAFVFTKVCYIPYALPIIERYMVKETTREAVGHFSADFLASCWRIFCETEDSRALLGAGVTGQTTLAVAGSPKLDRLARTCRAESCWPITSSRQPRPYRIIWAPHHSIGADWLGFGVFIGLVNHMVNWAVNDRSIEIVLKPHPALFDQLRLIGAADLVTQFLACWNILPNTAIVEGGDYGPLFAGSDAMITDGISFLVEYLFADKPLIFVDSGRHVPFNVTGRKVVEGAYAVSTFEDLQATIEDPARDRRRCARVGPQSADERLFPCGWTERRAHPRGLTDDRWLRNRECQRACIRVSSPLIPQSIYGRAKGRFGDGRVSTGASRPWRRFNVYWRTRRNGWFRTNSRSRGPFGRPMPILRSAPRAASLPPGI